ncbi:MAG: hypothetical protein WBM35_16180 [Candidatus Electrothrix sp.]
MKLFNKSKNKEKSGTTPAADSAASADASVEFINKQVLDATAAGDMTTALAKPLADQAAAMMLQDMRSYLQSSEQILASAMAKALEQMLSSDGAKGSKTLEQCEKLMVKLPEYAAKIASTAGKIPAEFK